MGIATNKKAIHRSTNRTTRSIKTLGDTADNLSKGKPAE